MVGTRKIAEEEVSEEQYGLKMGIGYVNMILGVRLMTEKISEE